MGGMGARIRVLLAEDDARLRRTLVELLALESDLSVVSDVGDGEEAVRQALALRPDILLTDIEMPRLDGIAATRQVSEALPDTRIVMLSKFDDDERLFEAIKAGAVGYVLKDAGLDSLVAALREAHEGSGHLSPAMVARMLGEFRRVSKAPEDQRKLLSELTRREVEVLELLARGAKNRKIADELFLSEKTVKSHVTAILKKLHVNDRAQAALVAKRKGLLG